MNLCMRVQHRSIQRCVRVPLIERTQRKLRKIEIAREHEQLLRVLLTPCTCEQGASLLALWQADALITTRQISVPSAGVIFEFPRGDLLEERHAAMLQEEPHHLPPPALPPLLLQ